MKRIKRVMLIYPNQRWQKTDLSTTWNLNPYTICLLATMIKDDVDVKIVDAQFYDMSQDRFRKEIEEYNPDLIGISMLSSEYHLIGEIAVDIAKEVNPNIIVVMGGVHVTSMYERVIENPKIDYAVRGEGEYVFRDLIRYLNKEGSFPTEGIVYKDKNGNIKTLPAALIEDLDALPFPDYDFIDFQMYSTTVPRYGIDSPAELPFVRIPTVRGCPVGCSFCQVELVSGKKHRMRSAANVVAEMKLLKEKYGIKSINFEDDNAFFHKGRSIELLRMMIECKLNLKWKANGVALFTLDDEILQLMAESGCLMINVAIESANERVLKDIVMKPVNLKTAPEKIALAKKYGIYVCANFVIGMPGETWSEIRETLCYAETCGSDYVKIFIANPISGTKMYDMAKEKGYIVGDDYEINWRYGRVKTPEFNPKDISILRVYEWDRINFTDLAKRKKTADIMNISLAELEKIRRQTREVLTFEDINENGNKLKK
ncbi:MAG: radical SAM protein [Candidatus Omnitrophota bacterium]